jgi:hypothetical protein
MKTKITILIITIIFGLASCTKNDDELNLIEFTQIGQNNLYGNGNENIPKQNLIISESDSWNQLIDKMNTVNAVSNGFTETDIDFTKYIIIAVFDEIKGNGGHSIDIIKIEENENKVFVIIENILKGDATTVMTQPFQIVKIQKTDKLIIFE